MNQCPYCLKQYKIKSYFNRHVSACDLLRKSSFERNDDMEINKDIPDIRKLYDMVIALTNKNKTLEEKVEKLSKYVEIKKKQIHLKEWLDQNYMTIQSYNLFMLTIKMTKDDFELVCKYDYIKALTIIFKKIFPFELQSILPLKSFEQKENTIFIKNDDGWSIMTNTDLENIITIIGKQLMTLFVSWQESNKYKIKQDSYVEEYMNILQKMLMRNEIILSKVKNSLYKHLKINLKNIIQLDIIE